MDFEITVDRGSALFFDADACLMFGSLSSILLLSSKESLFTHVWDCYWNCTLSVIIIKHVAFFSFGRKYQWHSHLPVYLWIFTLLFSARKQVGSEQKFWRIDGFGEKKARMGGFAYPFHPPLKVWKKLEILWKHSPAARVPTAFLVLPNFHSCFYNSTETRYMFSIS